MIAILSMYLIFHSQHKTRYGDLLIKIRKHLHLSSSNVFGLAYKTGRHVIEWFSLLQLVCSGVRSGLPSTMLCNLCGNCWFRYCNIYGKDIVKTSKPIVTNRKISLLQPCILNSWWFIADHGDFDFVDPLEKVRKRERSANRGSKRMRLIKVLVAWEIWFWWLIWNDW